MIRKMTAGLAFAAALVLLPVAAARPVVAAAQNAAQVTAADAAPFLGDWTLELQGANGPGTFNLSIKTESEKVVAEISSDMIAKTPITSISKVEKNLVLGYAFDYQGSPVDAVISLMPAPEGKVNAQMDFAGGAYVMSGTATKKDKDK